MGTFRDELIRETFELSHELGFQHFLVKNVNRDDPVLAKMNPEERTAFLRKWWDATRDQMYQEYREQVAGRSDWDLLDWRADCINTLDAIGMLQSWREQDAGDQERFKQVLKGSPGLEEKPHEQSRDDGREM
jgi:hypothetical protein